MGRRRRRRRRKGGGKEKEKEEEEEIRGGWRIFCIYYDCWYGVQT